ncbi:hypothetical protein GCM10017786_07800 [Amycolatopsis deserti]|uniref:Uncharacterized protein n=1 Tax=Amycolatopsis deserti TaxID=185696 RepID=A0ABQ3IJ29_9PSEU|nr:hypothetical protein [Amycolatopsis deserti]GHE80184.1 hypothetical protein GCM10017786_07800 [Amycolatopsis deserti]
MTVYPSRNRRDSSPKRAAESQAEFFDRVAGAYWDQVRDVINEWWSHLPDQARSGVRSRLVDRNSDSNVSSALWELYLHEMLLGSGCTVEVEQAVGTRGKYPDFLVTRDGEQFVLEAIWTSQRIGDPTQDAMSGRLLDAINGVPSPNFFLSVSIIRVGSVEPPQRRLKAELVQWLGGLDPDRVQADYEQRQVPLPTHIWQEAGWSLSFTAMPRSPGVRGRFSRGIGIYPMIWMRDRSDHVLGAVKKKGGKYGDLALPFIVAVGQAALFPEEEDIATSLYGSSVEYAHTGIASTFGRLSDGYWSPSRDNGHRRVSGVLVVDNPAPWTWAKNTPVLWRSSDPRSIPAPILPTWASARLAGDEVERKPAAAPAYSAVGLDQDWPAGEAFPRHAA